MARFSVLAALAGSVLVVVVAGAQAALVTPNPVLVGPRDDEAPTATTSGDYLAFARQRPGQNALYDVWVKHGSDPLVKVNKRGQAFTGGIDGHELVYQRTYHHLSIRFYNLVTHARRRPAAGVNRRGAASFGPTISGKWLLFGREGTSKRVILRNMTKRPGTSRVLAETAKANRAFTPGQVNGDRAVWTRIAIRHGTLRFRYVSTASPRRRPQRSRDRQAPTSTPRASIRKAESSTCAAAMGCGKHVAIREHLPSGADTALAVLPRLLTCRAAGRRLPDVDRQRCTSRSWPIGSYWNSCDDQRAGAEQQPGHPPHVDDHPAGHSPS